MTEFEVRNCLTVPDKPMGGIFNTADMLIKHYSVDIRTLSAANRAKLEDCHASDRLAVTT